MLSTAWIELLEKVPAAYKDNLLLITSTGMEISLQEVLRTEKDYLVLRGRQAGTNDTGRVFFIPYQQITFMCVQKIMTGPEVSAMYGDPSAAEANAVPAVVEADSPLPVEETVEEPLPLPEPPPVVEAPSRPAEPPRMSKSELLARIRSRQGTGDLGDR